MRWLWLILLTCCTVPAFGQAATCNSADIQTAVNAASANSTVTVPAGNCTWTTTGGAVAFCKNLTLQGAGAGNTNITVNITTGFNNDAILFDTCAANTSVRITGFSFSYTSADSFGIIRVRGANAFSLRVDHSSFSANGTNVGRWLSFSSPVASPGCVLDHNTVTDLGFLIQNIVPADAIPGTTAWALGPPFETVNACYFENNTLSYPQFATHQVDQDCDSAGSYVFRYNTVTSNPVGNHGYDSTPTGCMMMDVYQNTLNTNNITPWHIQSRGGSGVWYDNITNGTASTTPLGVTDYRSNTNGFVGSSGHDLCIGTGTEDQNTAPIGTNQGWHCYQQIGLMGPAVPATTFTSFPLYEWDNCISAIGCTPGGANQVTIGVFQGACNGACGTSYLTQHIQANRDYYDQIASFTGATGIGRGTLASRPATCTTGVGYWGTDTNLFYTCTGTNTWGTYYTPFTYPHPLVSGGSVQGGTVTSGNVIISGRVKVQ
jgi:hypothetical protein